MASPLRKTLRSWLQRARFNDRDIPENLGALLE